MTIFKVFGETGDFEEYLRDHGLWYVEHLRCWCTLCSREDAECLLHAMSRDLPRRYGLSDPIVLVSEEKGSLSVTVQLENIDRE